MKKMVRASEDLTPAAFGDLQSRAYRIGYDLRVDPKTFQITLTIEDTEKNLPEIVVTTVPVAGIETIYRYEAKLKFPELDTSKESYYDSIEYYVQNCWGPVSEFITFLMKFQYDPTEWED